MTEDEKKEERSVQVREETFVDKVRPWAEMALVLVVFIIATVGGPLLAIYKVWGISLF